MYKRQVQMAILIAVLLVMSYTPLGYLKIGLLSISLLSIPVVIGAMLVGPAAGAVPVSYTHLDVYKRQVFLLQEVIQK